MQRYRVQVPAGVMPGGQFIVSAGGQQLKVTCPPNVYPGGFIEIQAPAVQQQQQQQQQQAPPPPPKPYQQQQQQPMQPAASATKLGTQCQASKQAEQQLASLQGPPSADLIFTAMDRDGGGSVSVDELQYGLSQGGRLSFSKKTCQLLVNLYDSDKNGTVNRQEFIGLWGYLDQWRACFDQHDKSKTGFISTNELEAAVKQVGYQFSPSFYSKLLRIYDKKKKGGIGFDEFIQLFCELHLLTEAFKKHDTQRIGKAEFKYEDFLDAAYAVHI